MFDSKGYTPTFQPADAHYAERVTAEFEKQAAMTSIGITLTRVDVGEVELHMPFNPNFAQQNGFLHAGTITTGIDTACGFAAFSLMPVGAQVLSVEFKINLLSPGVGEEFYFIGKVVKAGRTVSNTRGEVIAIQSGKPKLIATMDGTMFTLMPKD